MECNIIIYIFIFLIILVCLFSIVYVNRVNIYKMYAFNINKPFFKIVDQIETKNITINNIPDELKEYIQCLNIPNIQKNPELILNQFINQNKSLQKYKNDLFIYDALDFSGAYFPSAHTDIEWNKIKNDGFQIWSLIKNDSPTGNMFIFYNKYLYDKYKDHAIFLRMYKQNGKDCIAVIKNCKYSEFLNFINKKYIYELLSIEEFIKSTKKYYLDFKSGDSLLFKKNVIHMSDYRNQTNHRQAFNFRVAIKHNNKLKISNSSCGFVNDSSIYKENQK